MIIALVDMVNTVFLFFALLAVVAADSYVCEGLYDVVKIEKCENHEQYPITWDIVKSKMDRYTDTFSVDIEYPEDFGAEYALRMESFEKCDGGYKASDVVTGNVCEMLNKYAKKNFEDLLELAQVETKDCPIKKGKYSVKDYEIDYKSLPKQGKCGDHRIDVYAVKYGEDMFCIRAYTTFKPSDGDEEED